MSNYGDWSIYIWAIGLIVIIPILVVALGETIERLRRQESFYTIIAEQVRTLFLPLLVTSLVVHQLLNITQDATFSKIVTSLIWIAGAYIFFELFRVFSVASEDRSRWEARIPGLFKGIARALSIVVPLYYIIANVWGIELSSLVTAIGVGSLVIALALQDTLSSIVSGFLLVADKPFAIGDWIKVEGHIGKVIDLNWRSTRIMVHGRDVVVIPNMTLVGSSIHNMTMLEPGYRDIISLGFSYDDPPNKVKRVMLAMAHESLYVMKEPAPEVLTVSYDDSSIGYELIYCVELFTSAIDRKRVRDDLLTRVFYAASRAGLNIPFPIQTAYEYKVPFTIPTSEESMAERLATLSSDVYFAHLPEEQRLWLAERSTHQSFGQGEYIYRAGQSGEKLFIILSGQVALELALTNTENGAAATREVARFSTGDIVGESVLLSNQVNGVSCRVVQDTEMLVLARDVIHKVIEDQPRFALHFDRFLSERGRLIQAFESSNDKTSNDKMMARQASPNGSSKTL